MTKKRLGPHLTLLAVGLATALVWYLVERPTDPRESPSDPGEETVTPHQACDGFSWLLCSRYPFADIAANAGLDTLECARMITADCKQWLATDPHRMMGKLQMCALEIDGLPERTPKAAVADVLDPDELFKDLPVSCQVMLASEL